MYRNLLSLLFIAFLLSSCSSSKKIAPSENNNGISRLKFLDINVIEHAFIFQGTKVGGLSGIDYDARANKFFIICDDRSNSSVARFYTAAIDINNYKIDKVQFLSVHTLKQPNGTVFPNFSVNVQRTPDPESIRYNPTTNLLVWTSEGDRKIRNEKMIYQNPFVYEMDLEGNFKDSFFVPQNLDVYKEEKGSRENGVFEGSAYADDYRYLFVSMEQPIYEDGPIPTYNYSNAPVRFTKYDVATKKPLAQYAYRLDALAKQPTRTKIPSINGISEILSVGNNQFLVMERSFSDGVTGCTIKIYLADFTNATDVSNITGLHQQDKMYKPAVKKLLLNTDSLNRYIDNVEGITFGPVLPNGHRSLVLIADDNFDDGEQSQVFLYEIIP